SVGRCALGRGILFTTRLRPPPALVNANPPRQAEQQVAAVEPAKSAPVAEASANPSAIPGLPGSAAAPAPSAAPAAPSPAAPSVPVAAPAAPIAAAPAQKP